MLFSPCDVSFHPNNSKLFAVAGWGKDLVFAEVDDRYENLKERARLNFDTTLTCCCWPTENLLLLGGKNCIYEVRLEGQAPKIITHKTNYTLSKMIRWQLNQKIHVVMIPILQDFVTVTVIADQQLSNIHNIDIGEQIIQGDLNYGGLLLCLDKERYALFDLVTYQPGNKVRCFPIFEKGKPYQRDQDPVCGLYMNLECGKAVAVHQTGFITFCRIGTIVEAQNKQILLFPEIEYSPFIEGSKIIPIAAVVFSTLTDTDDVCFVMSCEGKILAYSCKDNKQLNSMLNCSGHTTALALSPDSKFFVVGMGYSWHKGIHGICKNSSFEYSFKTIKL